MIRVAIVGVGNCASSLVQGVEYYRTINTHEGLIIPNIFGYRPRDIEFVAAFDVDSAKVGQPLGTAIFSGQNLTRRLVDKVPDGCMVYPAPSFDGAGEVYRRRIYVQEGTIDGIRSTLELHKPDLLINYLPVGSDRATQFWAETCLDLKLGFLNAIPSFIVSDKRWQARFEDAKVPCAGDDVKSQVGATLIHRLLAYAFASRGARIENTYQLNFGGNMDFFNMLEGSRVLSKKKSKVGAVASQIPDFDERKVHISPTDYIEFLGDNKIAYINFKGLGFAAAPIEVEVKMSVWDSPNSAGVIMDVIRFMKRAIVERLGGALPVCDFYFKSPPFSRSDHEAEAEARRLAARKTFS
jgi:myo-inositol-1-phosphate synthase